MNKRYVLEEDDDMATHCKKFINRRNKIDYLKGYFPSGFGSSNNKELDSKLNLYEISPDVAFDMKRQISKNGFMSWTKESMSPRARSRRGYVDEEDRYQDTTGPYFIDMFNQQQQSNGNASVLPSVKTLELPFSAYRGKSSTQVLDNKQPVYLDFSPMPPYSPTGFRNKGYVASIGDSSTLSQVYDGHSRSELRHNMDITNKQNRDANPNLGIKCKPRLAGTRKAKLETRTDGDSTAHSSPCVGVSAEIPHVVQIHESCSHDATHVKKGLVDEVDFEAKASARESRKATPPVSRKSSMNDDIRDTNEGDIDMSSNCNLDYLQFRRVSDTSSVSLALDATLPTAPPPIGTGRIVADRRPSSPLLSRKGAPQSLPPTICFQLQYERWSSDYEKSKLQEMCILPFENQKVSRDADRVWKSRIVELPLTVDFNGGMRCIFKEFYEHNFIFVLDLFGNTEEMKAFGPTMNQSRCASPVAKKESRDADAIAPDVIPLRHHKPPRYRPETPYNGITKKNLEMHYYNELQCSWKPLRTESDWITAALMCVEHMYVMKVIVTTPTLAENIEKACKPLITTTQMTTMHQLFSESNKNVISFPDAAWDASMNDSVVSKDKVISPSMVAGMDVTIPKIDTKPNAPMELGLGTESGASSPLDIGEGYSPQRVDRDLNSLLMGGSGRYQSYSALSAAHGRSFVTNSTNSLLKINEIDAYDLELVHGKEKRQGKKCNNRTSRRELNEKTEGISISKKIEPAPYTTAHLLLSTAPTEVISQNNSMKVELNRADKDKSSSKLRLLTVPWVPDPHRKRSMVVRNESTYDSKQALGAKHPLKVRNNTVMIPKSDSTPDLVRIAPTKPISFRKKCINGHVDDLNSSVIPYNRELLIKSNNAEQIASSLEDQLLQTRWL